MANNTTYTISTATGGTSPIGAVSSSGQVLTMGGGGGANGAAGYLTNMGSIAWATHSSVNTSVLQLTPNGGKDAIIKTNHNTINLDQLYKIVMMIADKMMIVADDPYFTQKYPTLKDAYEQYHTLLELYKQGEESGD
jgi:hypothetical protein